MKKHPTHCSSRQVLQFSRYIPSKHQVNAGNNKTFHNNLPKLKLGEAIPLIEVSDNTKVAVFSTGAILDEAFDATEDLNNKGIKTALYSFPTVKPIDKKTILHVASKVDLIVSLEEHNVIGGFGSSVAEVLAENRNKACLKIMGIRDTYTNVCGSQKYLRHLFGIDAESIVKEVVGRI